MAGITAWWRKNAVESKPSLLFAYALGKAQRILAGMAATIGPVFTHGAIKHMTQIYRDAGIRLPLTRAVAEAGTLVVSRGPQAAPSSPHRAAAPVGGRGGGCSRLDFRSVL
jgi:putative mRNA 3-end processing factor